MSLGLNILKFLIKLLIDSHINAIQHEILYKIKHKRHKF